MSGEEGDGEEEVMVFLSPVCCGLQTRGVGVLPKY